MKNSNWNMGLETATATRFLTCLMVLVEKSRSNSAQLQLEQSDVADREWSVETRRGKGYNEAPKPISFASCPSPLSNNRQLQAKTTARSRSSFRYLEQPFGVIPPRGVKPFDGLNIAK